MGSKPLVELADADRLRSCGLRVTAPRLAVQACLREGGHQGVDAITETARVRLRAMSSQGAYAVLRALAMSGLVREGRARRQPCTVLGPGS